MNEYRRTRRRRLVDTVEIRDTMLEQAVGRLGNLSESGMLALMRRALTDDALYQLRFTLTDRNGQRREIEVGAHQLWADPDKDGRQFWCGLRFIDIGSDDLRWLREWVDEPGSQHV